ncbi:MAG: hypothetical protein HYZ24_11530 [Chloroflexi bacterium]|nr:hypothetical protein [Chloroflexota bacterium]
MSYKLTFTVNAIVAAVFGAGLLLMPEFALTQLGTTDYNIPTVFVTRFFGSALLMVGCLLWFLKDLTPAKAQKGAAFTLLAGSVVGFALSIMGISSVKIIRSNGWILLVAFGFFVLIYGYMIFLQPKQTESKPKAPRKAKPTPQQTPPPSGGQSF